MRIKACQAGLVALYRAQEELLGRLIAEHSLVGVFGENEEAFVHPVKHFDILAVCIFQFRMQLFNIKQNHRDAGRRHEGTKTVEQLLEEFDGIDILLVDQRQLDKGGCQLHARVENDLRAIVRVKEGKSLEVPLKQR